MAGLPSKNANLRISALVPPMFLTEALIVMTSRLAGFELEKEISESFISKSGGSGIAGVTVRELEEILLFSLTSMTFCRGSALTNISWIPPWR